MESSYYFVGVSLPPLAIGVQPELGFQEIKELYRANLSLEDFQKVRTLLYPIDLHNIRALWMGQSLDERGNLRQPRIEEALLVRDQLPEYLVNFLERYESIEDRLRFFSSLYVSLYQEESLQGGFLARYFTLEREIRLVLTALRAKRKKRDLLKELQFEDPFDPFVMQILAQKDAADYTPPFEYEELKALFQTHEKDPKAQHRALLEYRFRKIEEIEEEKSPFSLGTLLGYLARLLLVESWNRLDEEKGKELLESLE